jgi:sigma-B regulation protein RsbU (phosphoserine phosphatase)
MFGEERLINTLNIEPDSSSEELIRRMLGEVDRFADEAPQFDDITMLSLSYFGPEGSAAGRS